MELSLNIKLTDRRYSGESRTQFNFLVFFFFYYYFFFSTDNLGVQKGVQKGGPERGVHVLSTPSLIGQKKYFSGQISRMEFDHCWNWLSNNKFPGALQLLK